MNDARERLSRCFLAVFPALRPEDIPSATTQTVDQWDSVASVTLFTLIEEEFGLSLDMDSLDEFSSFDRILARIQQSAS